jgi:hypothetical protein
MHAAPGVPGAWCVCEAASNFAAWWHCVHTSFPGRRNACECGSWQSVQVTPAANIRLCANEPDS